MTRFTDDVLTVAAACFVALAAALPATAAATKDPLGDKAIEARIRQYRTADVTLTVLDAAGKPLAGKTVTVRQVRHAFLFGCNIFRLEPEGTSAAQKAYQQRYTALLNYATLPFYWGSFERREGATATARIRAMADWCKRRGIRTKGHPLCWHTVKPRWIDGKPLGEVRRLQLGRITREVTAFKGLTGMWDVVNEAVVMPTHQVQTNEIAQLCRDLGRVELIKQTFAAARKANPKATLVLNDFDTSQRFEKLVEECLAAGVPIDVVGIQSHMHGGYRGARWAWDVCERFKRFGKPIHFTELTITSGQVKKQIRWHGPRYDDWHSTPEGEARQAGQVREFYRILFSHPAVEAVTWWDFADGGAWLGAPAGLLGKDMSPKPAYEALLAMVKKEWWTGPTALKTDAAGNVTFRGYLGDYAVESGAARGTVAVSAAGTVAVSVRLNQGKE
jgi:endo-1,4-beta-xylanase